MSEYFNPHIGVDAETFMKENEKLLYSVANKYQKLFMSRPNLGSYDDLLSICRLGMFKAYLRYDPTKFGGSVTKHTTYTVPMMRGEVIRHLRDTGMVCKPSRQLTEAWNKIAKADLTFCDDYEYISEVLDIRLDIVIEAFKWAYTESSSKSLESTAYNSRDGEDLTLGEMVGYHEDFHTNMHLEGFLGILSERERLILKLVCSGASQRQIGEKIGVSQVQISRIYRNIMDKAHKYGKDVVGGI